VSDRMMVDGSRLENKLIGCRVVCDQLRTRVEKLEAERDALLKDREQLEWLAQIAPRKFNILFFEELAETHDWREAIDAARKGEG